MALRNLATNFVHDLNLPKPPFWMLSLALMLMVLSWVPIVLIARSRVTPSSQGKIHLFQDMDSQPKYKPQDYTILFQDRRAMRPPVAGTVPRGEATADEMLENGFTLGAGAEGKPVANYTPQIPDGVAVDERFVRRGQLKFNIYCAPCHGLSGHGNGSINQRADLLTRSNASAGTVWVAAPSLHVIDEVSGQLTYGPQIYPDGKLYSVIANGIRNMPGYAQQIEVEDRWAIVAYVRALQVSQNAPLDMVPAEQRGTVTQGTN
jgi:mono/diheme cytochrome c family protein